jgi:hypothetical protein
MLTNPNIRVPQAAALARCEQLQVCVGTETADDAGLAHRYVADARVPRGPWRMPTPDEVESLVADAANAPAGETLEILSLTETARCRAQHALDLGRAVATSSNGLDQSGEWAALTRAVPDLVAAVTASCPLPFRQTSDLRIASNDPGLPTTTRDPGHGNRLLGLHVDSHERRALSDRGACQRLLNVNIGAEPRWFAFLDISVAQIADFLATTIGETINRLGGTDAGREYLALAPECRVYRVRLEPGQGYLAPVQNLVHDGCSTGMQFISLTARVFGDYAPAAVAP